MMRGCRAKCRAATVLAGLPLLAALAFLLLDALYPFPEAALFPQPATMVLDRRGEPLRFFLPADGRWRFPVALEETSEGLRAAFLGSEDRRFFSHPGVDPLALGRALWSNLRAGRVVSGGSTITMQLARLAQPRPRTVWAKLAEAFRALQLERRYAKRRILELYLNLTPYGGNVVGVGAAARFYFGKPPDRLSLAEAALLAALPRSPTRTDPLRRPEAALAARNRVLEQLAERGAISLADARKAALQPLPTTMLPAPQLAPHFCDLAVARLGKEARVATSLDRRMQLAAEAALRGRAPWLHAQGLDSAAAVVLDLTTREVLALVGSPDFHDARRAGQVNCAVRPRSPGSALKPLLYGLAMDQGLVLPDSLLLDIPHDFGGYVPQNYDGLYRGRVTARDALRMSLNAPAVRLLARLGVDEFHGRLRRALTTVNRPAEHYGLALALGGCEVNLLELTGLYAALGAGGAWAAPRIAPAPSSEQAQAIRLLSAEACDQLTSVLAELTRPDLPAGAELSAGGTQVAWKTGTSYGHRDAWAVGYGGRLAIGVWTGNPDGRARKGISGATHAAPILFDLFRALQPGGGPLPLHGLPPVMVEVCTESHQPAGPYCPRRTSAPAPAGAPLPPACAVHFQALADAETGELLSGECLTLRPSRPVIIARHDPELLAWRRSAGMPGLAEAEPALSPLCSEAQPGQGPRIVSPDPATPYRLRPDVPPEHQRIALAATAQAGVRTISWFCDGRLLGSSAPGRPLFLEPRPGLHRLAALDDQGRMETQELRVE